MKSTTVLCFGAANHDIKLQTFYEPILESPNIAKTDSSPGGVARNISENLTKLGISTTLISRLGADEKGRNLLKLMVHSGMDISGITHSQAKPTGTYTALLNPTGELVVGMADMEICNELTPEVVCPIISESRGSPYWIVDCNVPKETLRYILNTVLPTTRLWVVTVSVVQKMLGLATEFSNFDGLILKACELSALFEEKNQSFKSIKNCCDRLHRRNIKTIIVHTKNGIVFSNGDQALHYKIVKDTAVDVTGATDAFAAGLIYGLQSGLEPNQAVPYGLAAARLNMDTNYSSQPNLSLNKLLQEMNEGQDLPPESI